MLHVPKNIIKLTLSLLLQWMCGNPEHTGIKNKNLECYQVLLCQRLYDLAQLESPQQQCLGNQERLSQNEQTETIHHDRSHWCRRLASLVSGLSWLVAGIAPQPESCCCCTEPCFCCRCCWWSLLMMMLTKLTMVVQSLQDHHQNRAVPGAVWSRQLCLW